MNKNNLQVIKNSAIFLLLLGFVIATWNFYGLQVATASFADNPNNASNPLVTSVSAQTLGVNTVNTLTLTKADSLQDVITQPAQAQFFQLEIPKIALQHNVIENVDPGNEDIYGPILLQNIAQGKYTRLPDEATIDGNVYLFAHRTGVYQGQNVGFFNRLDELKAGDLAVIHYGTKTYTYKFKESFIITPKDTWVYTGAAVTPTLTLQTCEQGQEKRLMVKFDLIEVK